MGKLFKFGQDVDTDQIIASQYIIYPTIDEMKVHTFESLDTNFASQVQQGDYVVASENFGCGSSREQAPTVLKLIFSKNPNPCQATLSARLGPKSLAYILAILYKYTLFHSHAPRPLALKVPSHHRPQHYHTTPCRQ